MIVDEEARNSQRPPRHRDLDIVPQHQQSYSTQCYRPDPVQKSSVAALKLSTE
jgi:hypothetical protein